MTLVIRLSQIFYLTAQCRQGYATQPKPIAVTANRIMHAVAVVAASTELARDD